ncbi:RUS family member 1-like isoform X1 [Nymphalis io]|uniref:RUS family member 1-like isoform X1 n=1 Tax=Inachis io TaxID=171585 RepID=UPI0021694671|nr:RUS family member 1-like isoform X1 [Nymphalis io]XP_050360485.1 RUS family member 1-like isoform X1 [Nymphalis io]
MKRQDGDIIFKEKYGSSAKERYLVKPPDQLNVVVCKEEQTNNVASVFAEVFLPQGYPHSVSKDYTAYQIWDTAQAFCSTISGTLATQEVLRGVGVGNKHATPLAATVTWVLKDGCGHLGKILFAYSHGTYLDAYSKKWRLYADTLNDAAMCIEIALPLFRNYITFALCVSTVMKAVVGVAGGATRAAMTQHHALRGNMADVSAKDSSQETAVNLIASLTALFIISVFGNSLFIFTLMLILHIVFNYFAVRAVCLRTLNEPRFIQVIDTYLKKEVIANPCEINRREPILFYQLGSNLLDLKICGFQIKLGGSMAQIIKESPKASHLKEIKNIYNERKYILYPNTNYRIMYIFIKDKSSTDDILCAYFHAVLLSITTCAINNYKLPLSHNAKDLKPFAEVCKMLQSVEWSRKSGKHTDFIYEPSYELQRYINSIATQEWQGVKSGLIQTGWDLSKHLLMVDEWRVCGVKSSLNEMLSEHIEPHNIPHSTIDTIFEQAISSNMSEEIGNDLDDLFDDEMFTVEPEPSVTKLRGAEKKKERKSKTNTKHNAEKDPEKKD